MTNNEIERLIALAKDNEELLRLTRKLLKEYKKLEEEVSHDALTGTLNRRILEKDIDYDVVVMCDVDNFKQINDTLGHKGGDKALAVLGELFTDTCRTNKGDFVSRYGGDEFALVLKNCSIEDAINKMNKVREEAKKVLRKELGYDGSISVGITEYEPGKDLKCAIQQADLALYNSKELGKDRVTVYKVSENKKDIKTLEKTNQLI